MTTQPHPTALVTGANRGIGLEVARQLGAPGFEVILACRDTAKGEAAAAALPWFPGAPPAAWFWPPPAGQPHRRFCPAARERSPGNRAPVARRSPTASYVR